MRYFFFLRFMSIIWLVHLFVNPFQTAIVGTDFKVQFGNAKVDARISHEWKSSFCNHTVATGIFKAEFLLIDCGGRKQGGFASVNKPLRSVNAASVADLFDGFNAMWNTLIFAITQCYVTKNCFVGIKCLCISNFAIAQSCPTSVQPKLLGNKHEFFAVISNFFV